jgi:hypothetical protein
MTRPDFRSADGLARIWFQPGATQQYYPLLHTLFWLQYQLWGESSFGHHLLNILLHAFCALLLARILQRLDIPGAWLAAAVFALHPVHVESVAWITELKNTLMLIYLKFDHDRSRSAYLAAMGLFVLGLLSKTVTATLPAALLLIFWWKRGRLSWTRDVAPLSPFFLAGIAAGLLTAWIESEVMGARGPDFAFNLVERSLIAGRVIWFYLAKLFWPVDLVFTYPRWAISGAVWWQYMFPAAALLLVCMLWKLRHRSRAPLAAVLYFAGTLFPVLGFVNVYPFRFSFVADHFQYLASLGVITLVSAAAAQWINRQRPRRKTAAAAACVAVVAILAGLTWRQVRFTRTSKHCGARPYRRIPIPSWRITTSALSFIEGTRSRPRKSTIKRRWNSVRTLPSRTRTSAFLF